MSQKNKTTEQRISAGDKLLIPSQTSPEKQEAIEAIASVKYTLAVAKLEAYLQKRKNDPEAIIYLNNARIGNNKSYTIAVSVPIGSDLNGSQEILL